jgi:magnesium chelatase family protein
MVAKVRTVAFHGVEVIEVETQVTIGFGLPAFTVVGLPDKAAAESHERVRAALGSLGLGLPPRRITVNLGPAKRSSTLRSAMSRSMRRSSASYPDNSITL